MFKKIKEWAAGLWGVFWLTVWTYKKEVILVGAGLIAGLVLGAWIF